MPEDADHVRSEDASPRRGLRPRTAELWLFRGIYGLVLASALVAALDVPGEVPNPGEDALWVLLTALASSAAHGYAHVIAQRAVAEGGTRPRRLRAVIAEWPLVVAALPTVWLLLGAVAEWWSEETAADVALLFNTIALLGLGISAARTAGLGWASSVRAGIMDMLIGVVIIGVYALVE
ncbi:hypothetical protein AB0D47_31265 [Streptomyces sp. NPDC048376]|jgi:hypothetical protein|uniref:hypothetical protein n=1 Tax=unclassified Streptomyces TaxID=2593676 RepID=UPI000F4B8F15